MMYYTGDYRTAWNNLSHGQIVTSQCPLSEGHYTTKNGELKLVDGDGAWCYSFDGATLRFLVGTGAIDLVAFASLEEANSFKKRQDFMWNQEFHDVRFLCRN